MKRHMVWIGSVALIVVLVILILLYDFPTRKGMPGEGRLETSSDIPAWLTCRVVESPLPTPTQPTWWNWSRSKTRSGIARNGLVADGDRLWIATNQGVLRLNLRTWQCDLFRSGAGWSLAGAFPLLPDGQGGLWAGVEGGVLRLSGDQWSLAYVIPLEHPGEVFTLGYGRTGGLCLELCYVGWRSMPWFEGTCLAGYRFPLRNVPFTDPSYSDSLAVECSLWERASSGWLNYSTPEMCEWLRALAPYPEHWRRIATASLERGEVWMTEQSQAGVELYHWSNDITGVSAETPYQDVHALAPDPVYGGVWMATEKGLVHAGWDGGLHPRPTATFALSPLTPLTPLTTTLFALSPLVTPPASLATTTFTFRSLHLGIGDYPYYDYVSGMTVDRDGVVWAVMRSALMRYDESMHTWVKVGSLSGQPAVIAADPGAGVWMAVQGELRHFRFRADRAGDGDHGEIELQGWPLPADDYRDRPTAMLVEGNGRMWIGTLQRGVWVASWLSATVSSGAPDHGEDAVVWRRFTITDGLDSEWITALAQGPDGRIYAAHHAGVSIFDPRRGIENGRWRTLANSKPSSGWANALAFDPPHLGGGLWVGYYHNDHNDSLLLRHLQNGGWSDFYGDDLQPGQTLWGAGAIWVDEDGGLWLGTTNGLWRGTDMNTDPDRSAGYSGYRWERIEWERIENEIVVHNVWTLLQDARGRVWVGGEEGLAMRDYGVKEGEESDRESLNDSVVLHFSLERFGVPK